MASTAESLEETKWGSVVDDWSADKLAELVSDWEAYAEEVGLVLPPPGPLVVNPTPHPDR